MNQREIAALTRYYALWKTASLESLQRKTSNEMCLPLLPLDPPTPMEYPLWLSTVGFLTLPFPTSCSFNCWLNRFKFNLLYTGYGAAYTEYPVRNHSSYEIQIQESFKIRRLNCKTRIVTLFRTSGHEWFRNNRGQTTKRDTLYSILRGKEIWRFVTV